MHIGLTKHELDISKNQLSLLLADTYLLYIKTQKCHWHVVDPAFCALHEFFGEQYNSLASAIDEIAERIRMLGGVAPASFAEFMAITRLKEKNNAHDFDNGQNMLHALGVDHELMIKYIREAIKLLNDGADEGTKDFLITRLEAHEKILWMIQSHYDNK